MTSSFEIIPAIDLLDGQVVRLEQGRRERKIVYSDDPVGFVKDFESAGAKRLHVVDLNGAFEGAFGNLELVRAVCRETGMIVELGGGIRSRGACEKAFEAGVAEVIIGTRALEDKEFIKDLLKSHGKQVIVGIDARDGFVVTRGWTEGSSVEAWKFAQQMAEYGCGRIIYTDIATDGMLSGPNLEQLVRMSEAVPEVEIVASGGISKVEDLEAVRDLGRTNIVGAITGRAIYDGRINLALAVQRLAGG